MIRVVKLGGSLLDAPELPNRLHGWLAEQQAAHNVFLVGGGPLADQVRSWHALRAIDDVAAHWMCVDLLSITARLLHSWLPSVPIASEHEVIVQRLCESGATIFDPARWLRQNEPGLFGTRLPHNWSTTSDAIAGRLASALAADELVLLKSALPVEAATLGDLAACGYVDPMLAKLAAELPPVRIVNLRSAAPEEIRLPRESNEPVGAVRSK